MVNGPEHFAEAESDLSSALKAADVEYRAFLVARAQVHATLALSPVAELAEVVKAHAELVAAVRTMLRTAVRTSQQPWATVDADHVRRLRDLVGGA